MAFKLFYYRCILYVAEKLNNVSYKLNMYVHDALAKEEE